MSVNLSKNPNVLLISGSGFLGSHLLRQMGARGIRAVSAERNPHQVAITLNLEKDVRSQLADCLRVENFSHAIVCAAITDVEECVRDFNKSHRVNVEAMEELAALLKEHGIVPIFFSSDLVFDGQSGLYREEDAANPPTLYGRQKLKGEEIFRDSSGNHLIFRTSKLMALSPHSRNILTSLIRDIQQGRETRAFTDQIITPVFVEDVASVVIECLRKGLSGTYHLAIEEEISRFELAKRVYKHFGADLKKILPIKMADAGFTEPRGAHNTILAAKIGKLLGIKFTTIDDGLKKISLN